MAEDEEIEQYLQQKLDNAIENQINSSEQQNLLSKFFVSFGSEFKELMTVLTKKTNPPLKDEVWLSVRRENLYYLNNLLSEWQMITKKHSSCSPHEVYGSSKNIKKSLNKMKKELKGEESSARGATSHHEEPNHPIFERNKEEVYRWSSRHGPRKVHGLEHKAMSMERELVLRNTGAPFKALGVVGVAGIGKTTLCQTVFGRQKVKEHFSPRIWVCLSKQPREDGDNGKEIVVRFLKCLGIEDEVISDAGQGRDALRRLVLLLRLQLIGKRYLIVIDDAWKDDKFFENLTQEDENRVEALAYGLPKGCGGSVILSSRSQALAKKMIGEEASLEYMKPLTDENCDEIFKDTVTGYDDDAREFPQYLKDLRGEILKRCDRLPLAARLLGQIAREHLPLEKKNPPVTASAGGTQGQKHDLAAGAVLSKTARDSGAGGDITGVQDNEHRGGVK